MDAVNERLSSARKEPQNTGLRRRLLLGLTAILAAAALGYGIYWFLALRNSESTSDAYVDGHLVAVTPLVAGTVIAVAADDTDHVTAGQLLVRLDPADARLALDTAETQLAKTVRQVRNMFADTAQFAATVDMRRSDLARAADDLDRRERLAKTGDLSVEDLRHAREALRSAQAGLAASQHQLSAAQAMTNGTDVADHPDVRNAAAAVRQAYLNLHRTEIIAPVAGTIARRSVQAGAHVDPGQVLMDVIPLDAVWVDANFKEDQLAHMRVGQPVVLTSDLYGDSAAFHGRVQGFGAGTGSAFALIPPQNATGNWVKVVQRVPVRIALDPAELAAHPLEVGLSMQAEVDTRDQVGDRPPSLPRASSPDATPGTAAVTAEADARIAAIITANMQPEGSVRPTP